MQRQLIYKGGCDMTFIAPELMEITSCLTVRYDAGICKHRKERTGVMEIIKISKERAEEICKTK